MTLMRVKARDFGDSWNSHMRNQMWKIRGRLTNFHEKWGNQKLCMVILIVRDLRGKNQSCKNVCSKYLKTNRVVQACQQWCMIALTRAYTSQYLFRHPMFAFAKLYVTSLNVLPTCLLSKRSMWTAWLPLKLQFYKLGNMLDFFAIQCHNF